MQEEHRPAARRADETDIQHPRAAPHQRCAIVTAGKARPAGPFRGEIHLHQPRDHAHQFGLVAQFELAQHGFCLGPDCLFRPAARLRQPVRRKAGDDAARDLAFGGRQAEDLAQKLADPVAPFDIGDRQQGYGPVALGRRPVQRNDRRRAVRRRQDARDRQEPAGRLPRQPRQRLADIGKAGRFEAEHIDHVAGRDPEQRPRPAVDRDDPAGRFDQNGRARLAFNERAEGTALAVLPAEPFQNGKGAVEMTLKLRLAGIGIDGFVGRRSRQCRVEMVLPAGHQIVIAMGIDGRCIDEIDQCRCRFQSRPPLLGVGAKIAGRGRRSVADRA